MDDLLESLRAELKALLASWEYAYAMGHGCSIGDHPQHRAVRERAAYLRARIGPGGRSGRPPPEAEAADGAGGAALFVSESPRNRSQPITIWTWSKVAQAIARRAGVERFTTHTPRHLRLTDLARAGRGAGEIARFAGHSRASLALRYLRLARERPDPAGRDVERRRAEQLARVLFRERR
jgi:integrase